MDIIIMFLVSMSVGSVIGGVTNFIAITMLFRPYQPHYIGSWKLPLTPGVIPKRHQEIAYQLGELVEKHLIPSEKIREKLTSPLFQQVLEEWLAKQVSSLLHTERSLTELLCMEQAARPQEMSTGERFFAQVANSATDMVMFKIEEFLYAEEGEDLIYQSIQQLIAGQGMLSNMLGAFLVKEKLVDKLRPIFLSALRKPATKEQIHAQIDAFLKELLEKEVGALLTPYQEELMQLPERYVSRMITLLESHIPAWFASLEVSGLVREQVLSFPLGRLEEIIKELAHRELRAITWLGALLGGVIGFFQALLLTVFF